MKYQTKGTVSRRALLQQCAAFAGVSLCSRRVAAQSDLSLFTAELVREIKGAQLCAVSPDGQYICVYYFRHIENFLREWSYDGGDTKKTDDTLRVVELDSGKVVYSTQLRSMVVNASFFAVGADLYAETLPLTETEGSRAKLVQHVVVDLHTRKLDERLLKLSRGIEYFGLASPNLLGVESSLQTARASALVLAALPDYKEVKRAPFAPTSEFQGLGHPALSGNGTLVYGHDTTPVVSADRSTIAYGAGHRLVCRRADDLRILWSRLIGPEYFGAWLLDITPDGSKIAAAVIDDTYAVNQRKFYVGVYNGRDGSVVNEIPLNGFEGVSISPNGKLFGVSQRVEFGDGRVEPTVYIYEVASGLRVSKVSHPPIDTRGREAYGSGSISSRFTPNGKFLLTSGQNTTRVWALK